MARGHSVQDKKEPHGCESLTECKPQRPARSGLQPDEDHSVSQARLFLPAAPSLPDSVPGEAETTASRRRAGGDQFTVRARAKATQVSDLKVCLLGIGQRCTS